MVSKKDDNSHNGHSTKASRTLCQVCGDYFYHVPKHVRKIHGTSVTDLIVEGKWENVRNVID